MPEFEHSKPQANPEHNYTPSKDAKPRTRRRSGGFQKEYESIPQGNMGEIDPVDALKAEKLSSDTKPIEDQEEIISKGFSGNKAIPQPSEATLAAIQRVEERIAQRKAEWEARREERRKSHSAAAQDRDGNRLPNKKNSRSGSRKQGKKKGWLASILSIFGLGPKQASRRSQGKGRRRSLHQGRSNDRRSQNRGRGGRGRNHQSRRKNHSDRRPQSSRS